MAGLVAREVVNRAQPPSVPVEPMGNVEVVVHVVWSDGAEEWRPARAVRWTSTHVMVGWIDDPSDRHREHRERLRAQDVMRSVSWLVAPWRA